MRERDRAEACLWIQVIIAGFVDDPEQATPLGGGVATRSVDLPLLERRRVAFIVDAYDQSLCLPLCRGFGLKADV